MSFKKSIWLLLTCLAALQGCDSNDGILDDDQDTRPLRPTPPASVDPNLPRPPSDAAVIRVDGKTLLDTAGEPILLRGIHIRYADQPAERVQSVAAVKTVGSNVVSIALNKNTSADQLRAALDEAVAQNLVALLTFVGPEGEVACTKNTLAIDSAVQNLWLNNWMTVLAEAKYQSHMMLNIASKWGPDNIFSSSEGTSYRPYIETYKEYIQRFRAVGLKVPLVIDAPGCGRDFAAFLGGRDLELAAADPDRNLILSVHALGEHWDSKTEILQNMGHMQRLSLPVIVNEFGESGSSEERALDPSLFMQMANGDQALRLSLPWLTSTDMASLSYPLPKSVSALGLSVALQTYLPQSYFDAANAISLQLVLLDDTGGYALSSPKYASNLFPNAWNSVLFVISEEEDLVEQSAQFDANQVERIGLRIQANGKDPSIAGDLVIDNISVSGKADPTYFTRFNNGLDGWARGWGATGPGGGNPVSLVNESMALLPDWTSDGGGVVVVTPSIKAVSQPLDLEESFSLSFKIFVPQEYASEDNIIIQPFLQDGVAYVFSGLAYIPFRAPEYAFGQWNTVSINMTDLQNYILSDGWGGNDNFDVSVPPNNLGLQILGVSTTKTQPILIDDIKIESSVSQSVGLITGYQAPFDQWQFGWGTGDATALTVESDGSLSVLPDWPSSGGQNISFMHAGLPSSGAAVDVTNPTVLNFDVFVPNEYSSETGLVLQPFYLDASESTNFRSIAYLNVANNIPYGQWHPVELAFGSSTNPSDVGSIFGIGVEIVKVTSAKTSPIMFRNLTLSSVVNVDTSVLDLNFSEEQQVTDFAFDTNPALTSADWSTLLQDNVKQQAYSLTPFGWLAWSWKGTPDNSAYDLSTQEGFTVEGNAESGVSLTEKGDEVVNGTYGIMATSTEAAFTP